MPKTHKSIVKRMKITKTGKITRRGGGINHFQAKKSRSKQLDKKRTVEFAKDSQKLLKSYLYR